MQSRPVQHPQLQVSTQLHAERCLSHLNRDATLQRGFTVHSRAQGSSPVALRPFSRAAPRGASRLRPPALPRALWSVRRREPVPGALPVQLEDAQSQSLRRFLPPAEVPGAMPPGADLAPCAKGHQRYRPGSLHARRGREGRKCAAKIDWHAHQLLNCNICTMCTPMNRATLPGCGGGLYAEIRGAVPSGGEGNECGTALSDASPAPSAAPSRRSAPSALCTRAESTVELFPDRSGVWGTEPLIPVGGTRRVRLVRGEGRGVST